MLVVVGLEWFDYPVNAEGVALVQFGEGADVCEVWQARRWKSYARSAGLAPDGAGHKAGRAPIWGRPGGVRGRSGSPPEVAFSDLDVAQSRR